MSILRKLGLFTILLLAICFIGNQDIFANDQNLLDLSIEEIMGMEFTEESTEKMALYGYMSANVEKVFGELSIENGQTVKTNAPHEWSIPHFHLFFKAFPADNIQTFVNIATEEMEVRNAWGNIKLRDEFQLRLGKIYRRFGLFNEKLDEVPTYLGIEPPELFDGDHLLLPRLTNFMIHGDIKASNATYSWSLSTDNGENGPTENAIPLGWDIRAKFNGIAVVGFSGYFSSLGSGSASSPIELGDGSPDGGVLPWMEKDDYTVFGGFSEIQLNKFLFKVAYWQADHDFTRDPVSVLSVAQSTDLNQHQLDRFFGDNSNLATDLLAEDDVITQGSYKVQTAYFRVGYFIYSKYGTFAPFGFIDWMNHPETIAKKTYGGDNESGISDDGEFYKYTVGLSYKPVDKAAIKFDHSSHIQKFNGKTEIYPEFRLDFSYMFN